MPKHFSAKWYIVTKIKSEGNPLHCHGMGAQGTNKRGGYSDYHFQNLIPNR